MDLLGGDEAVARRLARAAEEAGFAARVGIADSCIAAAAATRERTHATRVVPRGRDADYLLRRSLSLLPIDAPLRGALYLLGLRTCGDLAALPPAEIELRLGDEGLRAWRLAQGRDARWPFRPPAPGTAEAEAEFEPPVDSAEPLRFVLPGLIASVTAQLATRQRIPARLRLTLRVLADLCRRAVEAAPIAGPLCGVRLVAEEDGVARADQLDAFAAPAPDPGALHAALLPVFARWGDGALSTAVRHGAHLPGEHAGWAAHGSAGIGAFTAATPAADPPVPGSGFRNVLPLCLRRLTNPVSLAVRQDAEGRPAGVDGAALANALPDGGMGTYPPRLWKTRAEGPERVSGGWWARAEAREYWRLESEEGWLGLVYRDAATGLWYLEGWFD